MNNLKVSIMTSGSCKQIAALSKKGAEWKPIDFPARWLLIEHPTHGIHLVDSGYSSYFLNEIEHFPFSIFKLLTPVDYDENDSVVNLLKKKHISPDSIQSIFITHFHGDHIASLRDFPKTTFRYAKKSFDPIKNLKGIPAVRKAFIPNLLPDDFGNRTVYMEDCPLIPLTGMGPLKEGYDWFGDGSILGIPLPGHAAHQIGLLIRGGSRDEKDLFFVADAAWSFDAIQRNKKPSLLAYLLFENKKDYDQTFDFLVQFHQQCPDVEIITTHGVEEMR